MPDNGYATGYLPCVAQCLIESIMERVPTAPAGCEYGEQRDIREILLYARCVRLLLLVSPSAPLTAMER